MKKTLSLSSLHWVVVLFLLIIGGAVATNIWLERQRTLVRENDRLSTQARVISVNLFQNLSAVNMVLTRLSQDALQSKNRPDFNHELKLLNDAIPGIRTLIVADAQGVARFSNREELIGKDFSYRHYFKAPLERRDSKVLYVSEPFLTVLGAYTINLTRIISGPNGEFSGVVSAAFDPAYLSPLLESVRYSADMFSAIAHGKGQFLLMVPEDKDVFNKNLVEPDTFFSQHLASGKDLTAHFGETSALSIKQAIVWTTIQPPELNMDYPLLAAVSRDYAAVFASWQREAWIQTGLFALFTLICVAGLWLYQRRQNEFKCQEEASKRLIEEQNERYSLASDAASLGFWDYDIASHSLKWDDWMYRIYGQSSLDGEQPYSLWAKSVHPDDLEKSELTLQEAIVGKKKFDTEFRIIRPDGKVRTIKTIASAIRDEDGYALKMFGINFDITDIRRAEQRQATLVHELTRINDELNSFAYVASHDLKSPLRGIDQLATWITEDLGDSLNSDTQGYLRLIRSRINRMEMLLDDLLAYSRVGRSHDEAISVNTGDLVRDIFELTATTNKTITLKIADDMPVLQCKKVPLELTFRNLIGNAIKHHDKAQGIIDISARPTDDGYEFVVTDDGPGIPKEHQQRVFAMFQTLKPRDEVEGSGIGLSLVKKAVESVGGSITLESNGIQGSSFRFTWPTTNSKEVIA